ncbi:hypothetical protein RHMOL_Rhmol05G0102600 [Rhododendron molle]|uniref:Uncharacterized protein n=1 Tax=Rhododendron molle TaxID=49168 RepID=A0ACC0NMG6_RHOML|nr:hypothetical protein RHMOL_Rhmol05G0102600 [Rhododendron molle]
MDVVTEILILLRLPVKALLCFTCISKSWRNLIHSWDFVESHLKRSIETKTHLSLILTHFSTYSVDFDSLNNAVKLDHMLKSKPLGTQVLGSYNGLICISHGLDDIAIWNPSTRKCRQLPRAKIDYFELGHDVPYYMRYGRGYGVLVTREPDLDNTANLIGAFDLSVEGFRLVPLPGYSDKTFHVNVGVWERCLCITSTYGVRSDVWETKDYGVGQEVNRSFGFVIPIAYSKNGCEILMAQDNKKLMSPESSTFAQEMKMQSFENQMGRVPEDTDNGLRIIWLPDQPRRTLTNTWDLFNNFTVHSRDVQSE